MVRPGCFRRGGKRAIWSSPRPRGRGSSSGPAWTTFALTISPYSWLLAGHHRGVVAGHREVAGPHPALDDGGLARLQMDPCGHRSNCHRYHAGKRSDASGQATGGNRRRGRYGSRGVLGWGMMVNLLFVDERCGAWYGNARRCPMGSAINAPQSRGARVPARGVPVMESDNRFITRREAAGLWA